MVTIEYWQDESRGQFFDATEAPEGAERRTFTLDLKRPKRGLDALLLTFPSDEARGAAVAVAMAHIDAADQAATN